MLRKLISLGAVFSICCISMDVNGQVEPPSYKKLFKEDTKEFKSQQLDEAKVILRRDGDAAVQGTYFKAPQLEFFQERDEFVGTGGVIISYEGNQIQGDSGKFNTKTKQGEIAGNLIFSTSDAEISASSGWFDLEKEVGNFNQAKFIVEPDGYLIEGSTIEKKSEFDYEVTDAEMTTCHCVNGTVPWSMSSSSLDITMGGYAKARPMIFKCNDFPVFYTPYFFFPAKVERASGLLLPEIGYSGKNGFLYSQPVFANINEKTDLIFTSFIETLSRQGMAAQYTQKFSIRSSIDAKVLFSDESRRGDSLRGSQTEGLFDPTFDQNRWGGYLKQYWRAKPNDFPLSMVVDGRYVSDDLFVREINEDSIGAQEDRFITSRTALRASLGDYFNAELASEYSQTFYSDSDLTFQRLPELSLDGYRSWRVFGTNPYGLKLVSSGTTTATSFARKEGYEGDRFDINPKFKIPFYYMNIVNGDLNFSARKTWYSLSDRLDPANGSELEADTDRGIYDIGYNLNTGVERVYDIDPDSWLVKVTSAGARNQYDKLLRVKHTVEPFIEYNYTPEKDQNTLPLFDSTDRIRARSLYTYGVKSRLIGRFADSPQKKGVIEELAAEENPFEFGLAGLQNDEQYDKVFFDENTSVRRIRGEKRELVSVNVRQSYDDMLSDSSQRAFSDVGAGLNLYPNDYVGLGFDSNYDYEDHQFSSWGLGLKLEDDRGDQLRTRVSYIEDALSQVDGNLEIPIVDRFKIGYYGRYDERQGEIVENRLAFRILSSCDCWKLDLGYKNKVNPSDHSFTLLLTLKGLGDIGQS